MVLGAPAILTDDMWAICRIWRQISYQLLTSVWYSGQEARRQPGISSSAPRAGPGLAGIPHMLRINYVHPPPPLPGA